MPPQITDTPRYTVTKLRQTEVHDVWQAVDNQTGLVAYAETNRSAGYTVQEIADDIEYFFPAWAKEQAQDE